MFSSFQQRFPLQDLKQWVPMLELFPLDPEALSTGPPDAEILLETFLPGSVYGLYQKGEMFPRPFWTLPPRKVFQTLPISTSLPLESISVPKVVVSSSDSEPPIPAPRAIVAAEIPRVQTPLTSEIPAIRNKISTPSFNTRPSTPTRPGTPTCSSTPTRPSTPVDVRSSLPHSNSSSFSTLKKSPSVRDFLGTAANFAKETKPKPATQKDIAISTPVKIPAPTLVLAPAPAIASLPLERSVVSIEPLGDGPIVVRETKKQERQKEQMALVQYYSPVIQVPPPGSAQYRTLDTQNTCRNETSYKSPEHSSPSLPKGLGFDVHSPKEEPGTVPMDPQYRALIAQHLKKLQTEAIKVHSQFSAVPPATNNSPVLQQCSLIRFDRAFNRFDIPNSYFPEIHIESRHRDYVHHFVRKSVFKTAAAGSSRSIREVMQELRKDSIFLNTIEPGAILQALDDAVVARLRQSLSVQNSITRFGDASARMDDLRRFLESLTKDNGQCVEFEHWIEEVPADSEQTLPIKFTVDFADGTPAIRGTLSGPNALKDSVRRRIKAFKPRPSQDSEFAFDKAATTHGTPLKRTFGNKGSSTELRLYKRSRNGSSDDVSLQRPRSMFTKSRNTSSENVSCIQRPKHLSIITTSSNEKMRAISNSSVRDLILSPINTSSTQIDQISEAIFIESAPDSPSSTAGSMERWEQSSTLSRFSMGSSQTGITIPLSAPSVCLVSGRTSRKQTTEEERGARVTQSFRSQSVRSLRSLRREPTSESRKEDDTQSLYSSSSPAPAFDINNFLRPKKCRSISEISLENPKEYHAESLKRGFSSTSSLSKFTPAASRLPTVLSPVETEMPQIFISDESGPIESSDVLDMVTQIEEPEDLPIAITAPTSMIPAEPIRADSGFSSSDGKKSAHGLLKEIAGVGEDARKLPQGARKTTFIKDIKITAVKDTKDETKPVEERGTKKNKLFGRLKDRVKGLKKKVSGAMKSGKEN